MYGPIGYYINCDDALCGDCYHDVYGLEPQRAVAAWRRLARFEDWDAPIAITPDDESDTPTLCSECSELIPHALTYDGYEYVREAILSRPGVILEQFDSGQRTADNACRDAYWAMVAHGASPTLNDRDIHALAAWSDDGEDAYVDTYGEHPGEQLQWLVEDAENTLPAGILSVWDGEAGTWSLLDLRDETLGPVLTAWNDAYPDWL